MLGFGVGRVEVGGFLFYDLNFRLLGGDDGVDSYWFGWEVEFMCGCGD